MPLLHVNGVQVHVLDTGAPPDRPDAPVVVMGHGLLFSTTMWRHQIEALRASYRCIAVDWRGQGLTPATPGGYDMDTLYADLVGLLELLDLGPVHYAGLSMGGFVGIRLGARRPDLVRSLTLIDTSAGPEDPSKVSQYRLLASIYRVVGLRPLRGKVAPIMFSRAFLETPEGRTLLESWSAELAQQDRRGVQLAIRGVTDRLPVLDELGSIKAPTLVITGSEDVATPTDRADVIAELVPDAESVTLPGVGHVSTLEAPQAVNNALISFLAAH